MLLIRQGIYRWKPGEFGELLNILLRVSSDDRTMQHTAQDAGSILDGFTSSELNIIGIEEKRVTAEFSNSNLKTDAGAG